LSWNFSGDALLLKSSDEFCLCYLDHESTAGNEPSALDEFWIAPTSRVMCRLGESDDVGLTDKTTDEAFLQNAMIEEDTDTSDMPRLKGDISKVLTDVLFLLYAQICCGLLSRAKGLSFAVSPATPLPLRPLSSVFVFQPLRRGFFFSRKTSTGFLSQAVLDWLYLSCER
uniref:ANAPC4_WD40 domain-containing protein n=1 Tax=Schistocephalus solidus TaxID=70667 RepID=A0A183SPY2_SCHSO